MEQARPPEEQRPAEEATTPEAPATDGARCPYCHVTIPYGETAAACDACTAPHHAQCFGEHRGCAASGCTGQTARAITLRPRVDPRPKCEVCAGVLDPESWVSVCGCGWRAHVDCNAALSCPRQGCGRPTRLGTLGFLRAADRAHGLQPAMVLLVLFAAVGLAGALVAGVGLAAVDSLNVTMREREDLMGFLVFALMVGGFGGLLSLLGAFTVRGQLAAARDEQRRFAARKPARPGGPKEAAPDPQPRGD